MCKGLTDENFIKLLQHLRFYPGPCATLEIDTLTRNDGGRQMTFEWYVKEKAGVDANTTSDMEALNATLNATQSPFITIGSEYIVRNVEYEIVVRASNFLGESTEATLAVTRMADAVPKVELSSTGESILRSQKVMIRGKLICRYIWFGSLLG